MSLPAKGRAAVHGAADVLRGRSTVPGAAVLAFHDVLPDDAPGFDYAVSARRFRQQLQVLARLDLQVVPLRALAQALRAGEDVTGRVSLVFDDALVGVHHLALPELASRGWSATLHPVVRRLGVEPPWWPGSRRTMTRAELQEAVAVGVDVGAHGTTHACLPCLGDAALHEELHASKAHLEDLVGRPVDEVAYPYGHHDPRVRDAARAAGYSTGWTFLNGRVVPDLDPWLLPRLTVHQGLSPARLAWQLARRVGDWPDSRLQVVHPHDVTAG